MANRAYDVKTASRPRSLRQASIRVNRCEAFAIMPFSRDLLLLLLASGKFCAGLAIPRAGASSPGQYDLPNTWTPFGFTAPISVGDPPQEFDILVDWTWISTYVWTGTCYHQENSPQECLHPDQEYFNQSASRTFRYVPELYPSRTWDPNHFFLEDPAFVNYATDFFNVGPDSTEVVLQTSDFTFNLTDFAYPFVGIYGTSPVFKGDNGMFFPLQILRLLSILTNQKPRTNRLSGSRTKSRPGKLQ